MSQAPLSPLHALHQSTSAEFQAYAQVEIVSTFGEPQAEYAAVRKACGMMDLPQRAMVSVSGKDRFTFLNNLLTNQLWDKEAKRGLQEGQGVYAFFLNTKGRIVSDMNVLEVGGRILLEMDYRLAPAVREALSKYVFAEQVKIASVDGELHEIALHGPGAPALLGAASGTPASVFEGLAGNASVVVKLFDADVIVWRDDPTATPGLHLIVPVASAAAIWSGLLERFGQMLEHGKRALRPIGWAVFNACRIEGGRPLFGIDFDDSTLPAETGLFARAVSVTKGCYLGQEIVARMYARKQVARQVAGLRLENDALPFAGQKVFDAQDNEIGAITSSTISPILSGSAICLALLKKPYFEIGSEVRVPAEGQFRPARVAPTPFITSNV